jgi:hypothetical protein
MEITMLSTDRQHQIPWSFSEPGISTWRAVTLNPGTLFVVINYALREKRGWLHQTTILWESSDVLELCRSASTQKSTKIIDIFLIEPLRQGKIYTWRWTTVLNIKLYVEEPEVEMPVYITDAGEAVGLTPLEAKQKMRSIYKRRREQNSKPA